MSKANPTTPEPAWRAPDWLLIIRATWATGKLRAEAGAEIFRRNAEPEAHPIELSGRPERHQQMLDAAMVAEDARVAA